MLKENLSTGAENQLFDWENNDEIKSGEFIYYGCVLKKAFGERKKGESVSCIEISIVESTITLFFGEKWEISEVYELKLGVGKPIPNKS